MPLSLVNKTGVYRSFERVNVVSLPWDLGESLWNRAAALLEMRFAWDLISNQVARS